MEALDALREKIPHFPGYDDEVTRRTSDELVRSYVGEALALLESRHPEYFATEEDACEALLLRAGFMNQTAFKTFEYAELDDASKNEIALDDLSLLRLADRAATVGASDLDAYLAELTAAFDQRDTRMLVNRYG
jgi:hypothetical protein